MSSTGEGSGRKRRKTSRHGGRAAHMALPTKPDTILATATSSSTCAPTDQPTDGNPCLHEQSLQKLNTDLDAMRQIVTCKICQRFLYEPYALSCGHTFCYTCLSQWMGQNRKKTCPDCRTQIKSQPTPSYLIRELVLVFISRSELLPDGETAEEHSRHAKEEADTVAQDRTNSGNGGLFRGSFSRARATAMYDHSDNVHRCPHCLHEVEAGHCPVCLIRVATNGSDSDSSDDDEDSELESELDHEIDALDVEAEVDLYANDEDLASYGIVNDTTDEEDSDGAMYPHDMFDRLHALQSAAVHPHHNTSFRRPAASGAISVASNADSSEDEDDEDDDDEDDEVDPSMMGFIDDADDAGDTHTSSDEGSDDDLEAEHEEAEEVEEAPGRRRGRFRPIVLSDDDDVPIRQPHPARPTLVQAPSTESSEDARGYTESERSRRPNTGADSNESDAVVNHRRPLRARNGGRRPTVTITIDQQNSITSDEENSETEAEHRVASSFSPIQPSVDGEAGDSSSDGERDVSTEHRHRTAQRRLPLSESDPLIARRRGVIALHVAPATGGSRHNQHAGSVSQRITPATGRIQDDTRHQISVPRRSVLQELFRAQRESRSLVDHPFQLTSTLDRINRDLGLDSRSGPGRNRMEDVNTVPQRPTGSSRTARPVNEGVSVNRRVKRPTWPLVVEDSD